MADGRPALARPRVLLPLVLALLAVTVLFTPRPPEQRGALSSRSAAAGGARALHDAARRLGWRVERRTVPFVGPVDPAAVYAVLEPPLLVTAGEAHRLLDAVRAGAGLLVVVQPGGALADSLGLAHSASGGTLPLAPAGFCPDSLNRPGLITWPGGRVSSWYLTRYPAADTVLAAVRVDRAVVARDSALAARGDSALAGRGDSAGPARPAPASPRAAARAGRGVVTVGDVVQRPAVVGLTLGRGRVVAVADPDLLRNDVLRVCRWHAGVLAFGALDWLAEGPGRRLVFDEFHHGEGLHADPIGAVRDALLGTPAGRATLAAAAAALLLLAAVGVRPLAPAPRTVHERRSPLEHVGALARAYEQVGATRLVSRRLVRGLRRRHAPAAGARAGAGSPAAAGAGGTGGTGDDATDADLRFLDAVAARRPALAADARRLARAVAEGVPRDELPAVGDAVARLDQHLRPDR